jgi:HPt (histidine-containing phosphotransfer) domain-containing protein
VDQNQEDLKNLQQEIITNYAKKIQKELKSDQSLENIVQKIEEELKKG